MKSIRCLSCNSIIAKEENNKIIFRAGYGKRQVYHLFEKPGAFITCWNCKEINDIGGVNGVSGRRRQDTK